MNSKQFIYDIAGFPLGSDLDVMKHISLSKENPLATCFFVPSKSYYLQKLFSSYALFYRNSIDGIRKMFGLISHIESDATLLHGGLTINDGKNILLLGNTTSGKSTLTLKLGDPVDDDTLIYNKGLIHVPSKEGFLAIGRSPNKSLKVVSRNFKPKIPDIIFLLDKSKEGGFIEETNNISLEYYMPNYFREENAEQYIKYNNFLKPKDVPAYILGTDGGLEKTIEKANFIIPNL